MAKTKEELLHKKLGHFNSKTLRIMKDGDMVDDLPQITNQSLPCPSCAIGKSNRKAFPKSV